MRKSVNSIVGRSDQNLSSALDNLPDMHVRFAPSNEDEYLLVNDDDSKKPKKALKRKANTTYELDRQISTVGKSMDQFQAARQGSLEQLKLLFQENQANPKAFFSRLDPDTKLSALHYAARFHHLDVCAYLVERCDVDVNKAGEDGMTPLHYVARFRVEKDSQIESYEKVVHYLIAHGAQLDAPDNFQSTPLHHACERKNLQCAKILIDSRASIEACDRQKMRPLHGACFYGSVDTAWLLIQSKADVLATDETNSIPFAHACRNSHYEILEMFYKNFPDHEKIDEIAQAVDIGNNTLLHLAVASAKVQLVDLLIEKKVDPLAKREDGQTAIHLCAKTDSVEILEKLIAAGGKIDDFDNENGTILHKTAAHNKESVLKYALEKKPDLEFIQKKDSAGMTALLLAATSGHASCVARLLEAGADMFQDRDKRERSPVYLASLSNHILTLRTLLDHARESFGEQQEKLAVNAIDRYSRTGLHAAAELGHEDIVRELLDRGAVLTMKDDDEYTALMLCCKKNRLDVLKIFIKYVNDHFEKPRDKLNILEEGDDASNTVLHIAAAEGHSSIIKLLLEQTCDLQARNMISWLPIHCAAERGRYNSVRVLIENHSPVDPVDKNQQTPLHLAARNGHSEVVKLLLKNKAKIAQRTSNNENCLDLAIGSTQYSVVEILLNNREWTSILRNARYDSQTQRWDTPLRKLIRNMPEMALIVLNKSCTILPTNKNEELAADGNNEEESKSKKKKKTKSKTKDLLELNEHLNSSTTYDTSGLSKDDTELHKLTFVYSYEFLDDQFALQRWKDNDPDPAYEPDGRLYPGLIDQPLDRKLLEANHPFTLMVEQNREQLLNHPLVHSLLDFKWKRYARYVYYFNFLFYLLFVASLTTYVFLTFAPYAFGITYDQMSNMTCSDVCAFVQSDRADEIASLGARITAIHVFQWLVIVLASIQIVKELFQLVSERFDYINLENTVELTAFILAILFTLDFNSCSRAIGYRCAVQWQIGALGVFLTWFALVLFIQKFPSFGIYVVMLTDILNTFFEFFLVFFLFIIGFALAFHMLLQNHNPFQHFGNSLLKTCVMMIGEFEYEGIFHGDNQNYFGITYFFFIIFIVVMSIIIMNLLVGLAVDDITRIMQVATVKRLAMRVRLTLDVERQLPLHYFFRTIRRYRTLTYRTARWQHLLNKIFRIEVKTEFDKNMTRLEEYHLFQTGGSSDSQLGASTNAVTGGKMDEIGKPTTNVGGAGVSSDWITAIHAQINTRYIEFNRTMADLKTQQEKINTVLQQFPTSATSRHSSHLTFAPATTA